MAHRDPEVRRLIASKGAQTFLASISADEIASRMAKAREAQRAELLNQIDPTGQMDEAERDRRLQAAVRARMAELARRSVETRKARARAAEAAQTEAALDVLAAAEVLTGGAA